MKPQSKNQAGFTLIELVIVIVILGILAVTAIPKFVDLSNEASTAAAEGVAGTLASASAINYAKRVANGGSGGVTLNQNNVCTPTILQSLLTGNTVTLVTSTPANNKEFQIGGTGDCTASAGNETVTCTVKGYKANNTVDAVITCAR